MVHLIPVMGVKGGKAGQQLIEKGAEGVEIYHSCMKFFAQHVRGHVLGAPAETLGTVSFFEVILGQTEISDSHMTVQVYQNVLWLQVPVHDI